MKDIYICYIFQIRINVDNDELAFLYFLERSQPCAHLLFLGLKDINVIEKTSMLQFVKLQSKYPNKI